MLRSALLEPAVFITLSTCCTAADLTSTLTGTAGDVRSETPVTVFVCKSPNFALNLDISPALCCIISWISYETVLNLLSAYSLDLLVWFGSICSSIQSQMLHWRRQLQITIYNTTYNIWTSTQYNIINNNTKFKDQL